LGVLLDSSGLDWFIENVSSKLIIISFDLQFELDSVSDS
jgi:hypothetical protein